MYEYIEYVKSNAYFSTTKILNKIFEPKEAYFFPKFVLLSIGEKKLFCGFPCYIRDFLDIQ